MLFKKKGNERTLGIQIVGLYPNMPGLSISHPTLTRPLNGCTQMSSGDEPVSTLVPWSTTDQHTGIFFLFIDSCDRLCARQTRKFHELCRRQITELEEYTQVRVDLPDLC